MLFKKLLDKIFFQVILYYVYRNSREAPGVYKDLRHAPRQNGLAGAPPPAACPLGSGRSLK